MRTDHTRAEAVQWALNHAEAAESYDKEYRRLAQDGLTKQRALTALHREATLATMWAQIAQAMPTEEDVRYVVRTEQGHYRVESTPQ